jgi:signal transduction histidine kinase
MTGLLLDTPLNFEQRELTNTARLCGSQLLDLVNDILDFSKVPSPSLRLSLSLSRVSTDVRSQIEAGRMEFEETPFCLVTIADDICELSAERAQSKGLHLAFSMDPTVPGSFMGDGGRVRQVVANLVSNAIKFTETGGVTVRLRVMGEQPQPPPHLGRIVHMRVEVSDTGIGMTAVQKDRLFKPFSQASISPRSSSALSPSWADEWAMHRVISPPLASTAARASGS